MAVGYNPKIVTDGLVLALDAGNTKSYPGSGTTWTDLSPSATNASLINGPTFNSSNLGYINFDGTNDLMTVSSLPSGTNLFTYSLWLYFNANISGNFGGVSFYAAVLLSGNTTGTIEFLILTNGLVVGPPHTIAFSRYGGGVTGSCSISNVNMPIQTWHNLVLVRDGAASQVVYLNGVAVGTGNVSNSFDSGTAYIGGATASPSYSGYFNGRISNVLRYNRALTAAEVLQNFNALRGRFGV